MLIALTGALVPVLAGVALALSPWFRAELARPARVVAAVAAAAVVLVVLLPQSWRAMGPASVAVFAVAAAVPAVLERLASRRAPKTEQAALLLGVELGFFGLAVHQIVEGAEIGAAWRLGEGAGWLTLAIGAHTLPLVAVVIDGVQCRSGPRAGLVHGLALAAVGAGGVVAGGAGIEAIPGADSWLPAVVGGLLAHVLWHEVAEHKHQDHT